MAQPYSTDFFTDLSDRYDEPEEIGVERARELYQYYRPPQPDVEKTNETVILPLPYPDPVLQAHAQLAAYRLDVQRAMIGLVDKEKTYYVAEATKTLDLANHNQSETGGDGLWYGPISSAKRGGLVEWTLSQDPRVTDDGEEIPAHYEVLDMSKDPRWKDNRFVNEPPYCRYYCGLPLRTDNDVNIGALFCLDDKARESTSAARLKVLYTLAENIMAHMRTVKDAHEKQRAIYMNMCMADFISPDFRFRNLHLNPQRLDESASKKEKRAQRSGWSSCSTENTPASLASPSASIMEPRSTGSNSTISERMLSNESASEPPTPDFVDPDLTAGKLTNSNGDLSVTDTPETETSGQNSTRMNIPDRRRQSDPNINSTRLSISDIAPVEVGKRSSLKTDEGRGRKNKQEVKSSASSTSPGPRRNITEAEHQRVFDRAAYLLRQALDLSKVGGGGVVLLDTNANADSTDPINRRVTVDYDANAMSHQTSHEFFTQEGHAANQHEIKTAYSGAMKERVVLAAASVSDGTGRPKNFGRADSSWKVTLMPPELQRMCKRHHRGKLYNLSDNVGTSLFDWEGRPIRGRLSGSLFEMVLLRRQFPDAKQVIFVPMFHPNINRWTSCFAWTNSRYRIFSYEMDYLPTLSFCNAIRAEIVRLATVFADQQKGDFIGSVSHELRSPLHGILASLELIQDTDCNEFQTSCINTMHACAHTLLNTVSMVLDYNKMSKLQHRASRSSLSNSSSQKSATKIPTSSEIRYEPVSTIDQDCDVARITEEVVDGLATGQMGKCRTNIGFDEILPQINNTLGDVAFKPGMRRILNAVRPEVELILDIEALFDWSFSTQPGAIRRIVMNLFGNSLKYTKHGFVTVSLHLANDPRPDTQQSIEFAEAKQQTVRIVITDTGQGISPEYLRTKVFTAFTQENTKSAGTGLGLNIVRSLVTMLRGEIDIKSIINVGTRVIVTLPMKPPKPRIINESSGSVVPPVGMSVSRDPNIAALRQLQSPPQTAIYEPSMEHDSFGQTQGAVAVHAALVQYLNGWFGLPYLQTWDFNVPAKILIVDEIHLPTLIARRPRFLDELSRQIIVILCAHPGRQSVLSKDIASGQVELVSKPFGPYKLARALCSALEKAAKPFTEAERLHVIESSVNVISSDPSSALLRSTNTGDIGSRGLNNQSLSRLDSLQQSHPRQTKPINIDQTHSKEVSSSTDGGFPFPDCATDTPSSHAASKAMSSPPVVSSPPLSRPALTNSPAKIVPTPPSSKMLPLQTSTEERPALLKPPPSFYGVTKGKSFEETPGSEGSFELPVPSPNTVDHTRSIWDKPGTVQTRKPRLLLVDDNKLNLQLLHTYVQKRGYDGSICKLAEDGQEAVDVFVESTPDIVFMDLSMPVMDGFEATREIRRIEAGRIAAAKDGTLSHGIGLTTWQPALVIALTGNAKGSDQTEALNSGIDIYMTKPVSLKQVGKLLENWREAEESKIYALR